MVKSPATNIGDTGDVGTVPGSGRSPGNPLQDSCLEKSHGQRKLAGYSPWGRKESDTTEHACRVLNWPMN